MTQPAWCIPGFLGLAADWDILPFEHRAVELFKNNLSLSLSGWASEFNALVASEASPAPVIGYSLGGRLALHAIAENPSLYSHAVIVSSHLGFEEEAESALRIEQDSYWAERFLRDGWELLMHDWDNQLVFNGKINPFERHESDFERAALAHALRAWSLGKQRLPLQPLREVTLPLLWIVGENDNRFQQQAERAKTVFKNIEVWRCPDASHRVLWESPDPCIAKISAFLEV